MDMKRSSLGRTLALAASALAVLAAASPSSAGVPRRTGGAEAPAPAAPVADPAFDAFVDPALFGRAWADTDPALLTDLGLQMAEGERVLMRPHKGITSDEVLGVAAKMAAEKHDAATLARLAKAADVLGKKELAGQVGAARKLASAARDAAPAATVSVETTTREGFVAYKEFLRRIDAAKFAGDAKALDAVAKAATRAEMLTEEDRKAIAKAAEEAKEAMPKDAAPDAAVVALKKLAGESRSDPQSGDYDTHYTVPGSPPVHAYITMNGDGTGTFTMDDGSTGDIAVSGFNPGATNPQGPQFPAVMTGTWSTSTDSGTFRWQFFGNGRTLNGTWKDDNGGASGKWYGSRPNGGGPIHP